MDFGRIALDKLGEIDFSLPNDPPQNKAVLGGRRFSAPELFLGTTRWTATEWVGQLYPRNARPPQFLTAYARQFNTVELNATHYKIYGEQELRKWVSAVEEARENFNYSGSFVFCPKLYQGISHRGSLKGKEQLLKEFVDGISFLQAATTKCGPVFIQLSDQFSPSRQVELLEFLASLPAGIQWMLELRHPDWFAPSPRMEQFYEVLQQLNIGLVLTDVAGRRDVCHMRLTMPVILIRFVGNQLHPTDFERLDQWANRLNDWFEQGLKQAYFFLHMGDESVIPSFAAYAGERFRKITGLPTALPLLEEEPKQGELF